MSGASALVVAIAMLGLATTTILLVTSRGGGSVGVTVADQDKQEEGKFRPTPAQWATLTVQPVELHTFRTEHLTEGKIAVDEDWPAPRCGTRH